MKTYICCELVEAELITRGDYNRLRGWNIPTGENPNDKGYLVNHDNSYVSWVPKEKFEKHCLELKTNNKDNWCDEYLMDTIAISDNDVFIGEESIIKSSDQYIQIKCLLGGTYEITCISNKDKVKTTKEKLLDFAWEIWSSLVTFAIYGFNYKKGEKDDEEKND